MATPSPSSSVGPAGRPTAPATGETEACTPTIPTTERPPADANTASFASRWYRSADRKIWVGLAGTGIWYAGAGANKALWVKAPGMQLQVEGHRLGDPASALVAEIASGYEGADYQASGLRFPTPGCWHIAPRTAQSVLQATVNIYPESYRPVDGRCVTLKDVVHTSDAILVGAKEGQMPDLPGFTRVFVCVTQTWKGDVSAGSRLEVFGQVDVDPHLEVDHSYVFFLQARSRSPWRAVCPQRSLVEVTDGRLIALQRAQAADPLWPSTTLASLAVQVRAAL